MTSFADLHIHTIYSDGTCYPYELVNLAKEHGLSAIAITDHDTVDGIDESMLEGKNRGVEIIPGIELSAQSADEDVHILGYFIDWKDNSLKERLEKIRERRIERIKKIVYKLSMSGIYINSEDIFRTSGMGVVGRLHIARHLLKKGLVATISEAFDVYIGKGKPAYEPVNLLSVKDAIALIQSSDGIPVYAHPGLNNGDHLIPFMIDLGLAGIEVFHPSHSDKDVDKYLEIAKSKNMLITGGSDCHQSGKGGHLMGSIKINYSYIEKLKNEA